MIGLGLPFRLSHRQTNKCFAEFADIWWVTANTAHRKPTLLIR
jgi:hypothetical protein